MKIGVLGTGAVGQALATGFSDKGHEVKMGSREPGSDRVVDWVNANGNDASAGTLAETAAFADVLVLATSWSGTENAINMAGPTNFVGKPVIDVTNPLEFGEDGSVTLTHGHTDSGGEQVQRWLPDAQVVKAFNSVFAEHMVNPDFSGGPPDLFICGNDDGAKKTVTDLGASLGWSVVNIGGIEGARALEPLLFVLFPVMMSTGSRDFAVKLIRK